MEVPKIEKTMNFEKFSFIEGNRLISKTYVNQLVSSIAKRNLLHLNPIKVDTNFKVIDGQHRLKAAEILKTAIYYITDNSLNNNDIKVFNAIGRIWKLVDFTNYYVQQYHSGKKEYVDYEDLKIFTEKYNLSYSVACHLLITSFSMRNESIIDKFKLGLFKIKSYDRAEKTMALLIKLIPYTINKVHKNRDFIISINKLLEKYTINEIITEIKKSNKLIIRQVNSALYLENIREITSNKLTV